MLVMLTVGVPSPKLQFQLVGVPPAGTSVKVTLFPVLIFPLAGFIVKVSVGFGIAATENVPFVPVTVMGVRPVISVNSIPDGVKFNPLTAFGWIARKVTLTKFEGPDATVDNPSVGVHINRNLLPPTMAADPVFALETPIDVEA